MSYSRRSRYSLSPSPYKRTSSRSFSPSPSRSRSRSGDSSDAENPGNNLYVTGLSTRVSQRDLEKHFSTEGEVKDVRLVVDPWTQESRGFGFVTMTTVEEADRCVKYLDRSVLQGRVITVEKVSCVQQLFSKLTNQIKYNQQISDCCSEARRRRGRTPTPGRYLGLRNLRERRESPTYSRSVSPCFSSERERGSGRSYSRYYNSGRQYYSSSHRRRSYSPHHRRGRSYSRSRSPSYSSSPVRRRDRSYSPINHRYHSPDERYYHRRHYRSSPETSDDSKYRGTRSRSPSPSYIRSPARRRDHSHSPTYHRYHSPDERYYRRHYRSSPEATDDYKYRRSRSRSHSRSISPVHRRYERRYSRSISPRRSVRSYSRSISPRRSRRSYSRSVSPKYYRKSYCRSVSHGDSRSSRRHSRSPSADSTSQSR